MMGTLAVPGDEEMTDCPLSYAGDEEVRECKDFIARE